MALFTKVLLVSSTGAPLVSGSAVPVVGIMPLPVSASFVRPSDTTPYTAKDVIGNTGAAAILTFTNMARVAGGSGGIVTARMVTSQTTNVARVRLYLYRVVPTPIADNAPWTMLDANKANMIGYIDFGPAETGGAGSDVAESQAQPGLSFVCAAASRDVYGVPITLDVFTPASAQAYYFELLRAQD